MTDRSGPPSRTGARRPVAAGATPARRTTTHRGVRWRRDPDGSIGWYNDDARGWVRWRPGADAPPLPPDWEADAAHVPLPPRLRRASWRSPYRLVPLVLVVVAVGIGAWQAFSAAGGNATADAHRRAAALVGHCLGRTGSGTTAHYTSTAVPCSSSSAVVRVVALRSAASGPGCPAGTSALQYEYLGVPTADLECVEALSR